MKKLFTLTLLIYSLFTFTQAEQNATEAVTKVAEQPKMTITDVKGVSYEITGTEEGFNVKGLEGKVIFLEFFGHRCPPCLKSIPELIKFQEKHKDNLAIISIEVQGYNNKNLTKFAKRKGMNYIVVADEKAGSFTNYIAQRAEWQGSIPFLIALDAKGTVQFVQAGRLPEAALEELLKQLTTKVATK